MNSKPVNGDGGHYSVNRATNSMALLKEIFPDGLANEMNFVFFSTSGVHGTYQTIEEEERNPGVGVTFVIVQPRMVRTYYGNVYPETSEDFEYLKKLRRSSKYEMERIG